jgi:hypothetical protein
MVWTLHNVQEYMVHADTQTTMIYVNYAPEVSAADKLPPLVGGRPVQCLSRPVPNY